MSVLWRLDIANQPDWEELSKRGLARALKSAMQSMAEMWQRYYLPLHFQPGNAARYHYQPRKPNYLKRKAHGGNTVRDLFSNRSRASFTKIAQGGVVDLVYRGLMKRQIVKGSTVRGYPTRASVILNGPTYFTLRPRNPARPNLAREILALTDGERKALRFEATTTFAQVIRTARRRPRQRVA